MGSDYRLHHKMTLLLYWHRPILTIVDVQKGMLGMSSSDRDVFICHASEDKDAIVFPLSQAFEKAGISYWYDEAEIQWGDSITQKVNVGLRKSRFALVIMSATSARKNWPNRELNALINQEASSGEVRILPLLVGDDYEVQDILAHYPLLNDKLHLRWSDDINEVVNAMLIRLGRVDAMVMDKAIDKAPRLYSDIPLPKIKKRFSQKDKDVFLRESFAVLKGYFRKGLYRLEQHYREIETDFQEVHRGKFIATIYWEGEVANRCKIWLGGFGQSNSISYYSGHSIPDTDNAANDMLCVTESTGDELTFSTFGIWRGNIESSKGDCLTVEEAADYLWHRFVDVLGSR